MIFFKFLISYFIYFNPQSYEWALEAMKYVSSMRMEHCASGEGVDKLLRSLTVYMAEHPPVPEDSFEAMMAAAQGLHNDKLLEQCRLARSRCQVKANKQNAVYFTGRVGATASRQTISREAGAGVGHKGNRTAPRSIARHLSTAKSG